MFTAPRRQEIDHRTIKLIVGVVATSLAGLTRLFAGSTLPSISASYYEGGWSQTIFIGFLFAIAAFLLAYNGVSRAEMILSKVAAVAGLGIALFPCRPSILPDPQRAPGVAGLGIALFPCRSDTYAELIPHVHGVSAAVMFLMLAYFCYGFYRRARAKGHAQANARATLYAVCGAAILISIIVLALDHVSGGVVSTRIPNLTYYGEATGLISFGISWLTASRSLPVLTHPGERFSPFREGNPP